MNWNKHAVDDAWARRNPNDAKDDTEQNRTKALVLRIVRWADNAKTEKLGQDYLMTKEFKNDLHAAVVFDNWDNSKVGLSKEEKKGCNALWKKYSIIGRLCPPDKDYPSTIMSHVLRGETAEGQWVRPQSRYAGPPYWVNGDDE